MSRRAGPGASVFPKKRPTTSRLGIVRPQCNSPSQKTTTVHNSIHWQCHTAMVRRPVANRPTSQPANQAISRRKHAAPNWLTRGTVRRPANKPGVRGPTRTGRHTRHIYCQRMPDTSDNSRSPATTVQARINSNKRFINMTFKYCTCKVLSIEVG